MQILQSETLVSPLGPTSDFSEELLHQLAAQQKSRKKWLLIQPVSNTSMMVDSGTVSMPLNLIMVATLVGKLFDVTFIDERLGDKVPEDFSGFDVIAITFTVSLTVSKSDWLPISILIFTIPLPSPQLHF